MNFKKIIKSIQSSESTLTLFDEKELQIFLNQTDYSNPYQRCHVVFKKYFRSAMAAMGKWQE